LCENEFLRRYKGISVNATGGNKLAKSKKDIYSKADYKKVTVKTSDGLTIQGRINLAPEERVSDIFTKSEAPFVVLVDVSYREGEGKILFVNKKHIVWVEPEDNGKT
jgi:hypothetical protein